MSEIQETPGMVKEESGKLLEGASDSRGGGVGIGTEGIVREGNVSGGGGGGGVGVSSGSESLTVRDALANYGLDLRNEFKDDHSALQYLAAVAQQAQQAQQLAQYGQVYLQHADKFQQYLKEQAEREAEARRQASQQSRKWWEAPEYDPSWQTKIYRDQNGELRTIPGADPSILQKYQRWVEHQRSFIDRLSQNPIEVIRPGIEQLIDERAAQIVEQRLRQTHEYNLANQILTGNAGWLFERDGEGRVQYHPDGRPKFSIVGQIYGQYVLQAQNQLGIYDVQRQHEYAVAMTQRDVLLARQQQAQGDQAAVGEVSGNGEEWKANFLRQAAANSSGIAVPPGNVNGSYQTASEGTRGLAELMRQEFMAAGLRPDATISR